MAGVLEASKNDEEWMVTIGYRHPIHTGTL
jgi:hypothetical protein